MALLQALVQLYESLEKIGKIEKIGWNAVKISYGVVLDENGNISKIVSLKKKIQQKKSEKLIPNVMSLPTPAKKTSNISSNFLYEKATYLFGYNDSLNQLDSAAKAYKACKDIHFKILKDSRDIFSKSIKNFFNGIPDDIEILLLNAGCTENIIKDILNKGANLLLMPLGKLPQDIPEICSAWDKYYSELGKGQKELCMVTGKNDYIDVTHPIIRNVRGSQPTGALMVSFNNPSFESFGKTQGYNSPVGHYAAFAYASALNKLLADETHKQYFGDTTVVYWSEDCMEVYQNILSDFFNYDRNSKKLWDIINDIATNENEIKLENQILNPYQKFYILGISPNVSRLSVRFFIEDTFKNIMNNIIVYKKQLELEPDSETVITPWKLLNETVNDKSSDKSCKPHLASDVLISIFNGTNLPLSLYYSIQNRILAEKNITSSKASIIKAFALRNFKEEITVDLNTNSNNPAYILGMLFSVLEEVQNRAYPKLKHTIRETYFSLASSLPAIYYPLLIERSQRDMLKLKSNRFYYQNKISEIMSKLGDRFPERLSLTEKGMFQLGYYQAQQERFKTKEENNNV